MLRSNPDTPAQKPWVAPTWQEVFYALKRLVGCVDGGGDGSVQWGWWEEVIMALEGQRQNGK